MNSVLHATSFIQWHVEIHLRTVVVSSEGDTVCYTDSASEICELMCAVIEIGGNTL
jgi:hypothetical protein